MIPSIAQAKLKEFMGQGMSKKQALVAVEKWASEVRKRGGKRSQQIKPFTPFINSEIAKEAGRKGLESRWGKRGKG